MPLSRRLLFGEWIEFAPEQPFHRDWIEDGAILFGPGQKTLIDAMLAVPADASQWDLVDAAGLCVRGFPKMQPESSRLGRH